MKSGWRIFYAGLALLVVASDQLTKRWVERAIPRGTTVRVISHFFNLVDTRNPGIAFSLFADSPSPWKTGILIAVSTAFLIAVVILVLRSGTLKRRSSVGLALIIGGAVSNLADRLRYGKVVDFLDLYYRGYHWPAFNVADSAIVVGAALLILDLLLDLLHPEHRANATEPHG